MNIVHISRIKAGIMDESGAWHNVPLEETPYYRALAEFDRRHFDNYRTITARFSATHLDEMRWFTFASMAQDIERNGFRIGTPRVRFNEELVVLDGQHRLAILLHIHGQDLGLQVDNNQLEAIWVRSSR